MVEQLQSEPCSAVPDEAPHAQEIAQASSPIHIQEDPHW